MVYKYYITKEGLIKLDNVQYDVLQIPQLMSLSSPGTRELHQ